MPKALRSLITKIKRPTWRHYNSCRILFITRLALLFILRQRSWKAADPRRRYWPLRTITRWQWLSTREQYVNMGVMPTLVRFGFYLLWKWISDFWPLILAPSTSLTLITGEFITKHGTLQLYTPAPIRHSRMSGNYENNNPQYSPDEARKYVLWKQQKERALALGHILGDVARNPEHEAWEKHQEDLQTRGGEPASVR